MDTPLQNLAAPPSNGREHLLAVGDIHGRADLLRKLLRDVLPTLPEATRLVFLGDYIDRGPESAQVVEALIELGSMEPRPVFLLGNHERMLLDAWRGYRPRLFFNNGGYETMQSYGLAISEIEFLPSWHLEFFRKLPLYWQSREYIFVHAGLCPGIPLEDQQERDLIWIREEFFNTDHDFGKVVVFGHTPFPKPLVKSNLIGIDTGAVYGKSLTCLKLPEMKFIAI